MLIPEPAKVDPNAARKLDLALHPEKKIPKIEGPSTAKKPGCCAGMACCKPKAPKAPSISPPKLKAPKMNAPKLNAPKLEGPKTAKSSGCCGPKKPVYQPTSNGFVVIPLDNTNLTPKEQLGFNTKNLQPGYTIVPITAAESYRLANKVNANKKIVPYDQEQLDKGVTNLGVVPMSIPQPPPIVRESNEIPEQKTRNEHNTSVKLVKQNVVRNNTELPEGKTMK